MSKRITNADVNNILNFVNEFYNDKTKIPVYFIDAIKSVKKYVRKPSSKTYKRVRKELLIAIFFYDKSDGVMNDPLWDAVRNEENAKNLLEY